jgi:Tfp pilus assembly protein PilX
MAMNNFKNNRGFALIIAIIFTSVILSLGLSIGSLGFKQMQLASSATQSQYAFYAADAGLECALYADQQQNLFNYQLNSVGLITCDNKQATPLSSSRDSNVLVIKQQLSLDEGARCADVTIYKYSDYTAKFFSQGYDVPCSVVSSGSSRFVSRGIKSSY